MMKRNSTDRGQSTRYPSCYQLFIAFLVILPVRSFIPEKPIAQQLPSRIGFGVGPTRLAAAKAREDAVVLPLSSFDKEKFHHVKTRGRVMPIIVMGEPILPGQRLFFRSGDPKFEELISYIGRVERDYAESSGTTAPIIEVGILGFNPENGQPHMVGVTAPIKTKDFAYSLTAENRSKAITTSFKGNRMFQLVSNPWKDPTGSFHMAHVEILHAKFDDQTPAKRRHFQIEADQLFAQIPALVDSWMELMFEAGFATPASQVTMQRDIISTEHEQLLHTEDDPRHRIRRRNNNYALYPPRRQTDRAIWVAALLNPIRRYPVTVCDEIRPAFLACRNDRDRLDLCISALQMSIGFLTMYIDSKKRGTQGKDGNNGEGVGK